MGESFQAIDTGSLAKGAIVADCLLRLHYDGLGAALGKMPPSQERQITDGAQMFLGAHAYYFTERRVPNAVMDRSAYFEIHDVRFQKGSWEALYSISLHATAIYAFTPESLKDVAKDFAKDLIKEQFKELIKQSVSAWKKRQALVGTPFDRVEPVLDFPGPSNQPVFDFSVEDEQQRQRLYERTDRSLSLMSRPIGHAASHCDVWLDDMHLHRMNRRTVSEADIVEGLKPLQSRLALQVRTDPRTRRTS